MSAIYLRLTDHHHQELWRLLVESEMRFRGYSDEDIEVAGRVPSHTDDCEYESNTYSWLCEDENGKSFHPLADEYGEVADLVGRTLSRLEGEDL